jgi:coenzyme F420 hydrogenase subunit beta
MAVQHDLTTTVLQGGYCVGCGACASLADSPFRMRFGELGTYLPLLNVATPTPAQQASAAAVCPFSAAATDETTIARDLFAKLAAWHGEIGFHRETYVGHVAEGEFRGRGSSGGMASWLASELLATGAVDGVVHVTPCHEPGSDRNLLFRYSISRSLDDVRAGAGSRYYPICLSDVLAEIRSRPHERFAFVGIPCFIKAVRLLARQDEAFGRSVAYCVGLVCGHLKSAAYADFIGWQLDTPPNELRAIEFREKTPGRKANHYTARISGGGEESSRARPMTDLAGGSWALGFFRLKACEYCDDMIAETADVVVGDAWLPRFVDDHRGTNVVVVRHPDISQIIAEAVAAGRLALEPTTPDEVVESQRSGLRYRREGLAVRLADARDRGDWTPPKRVRPGRAGVDRSRVAIYRQRERLARATHAAFRAALDTGNLAIFFRRIRPLMRSHARAKQRVGWRERIDLLLATITLRLSGPPREPPGSIPPP